MIGVRPQFRSDSMPLWQQMLARLCAGGAASDTSAGEADERPAEARDWSDAGGAGDSGGGDRGPAGSSCSTRGGGRLNLLLSYAGWDQDSWVDHLPRLLEPMGVVSHRAGTGREASDVLRRLQIHIAVVDLGLPLDRQPERLGLEEEGGARLLELLARLHEPPPTVVVKRSKGHRDEGRDLAAALRAGAFAVVERPRHASDLGSVLDVLRRCMTRYYRDRWPGGSE